MTVGQLTSFLNYANQYTKPFNEISGVITELENALACAKRLFDFIDTPAQEPDAQMLRSWRKQMAVKRGECFLFLQKRSSASY